MPESRISKPLKEFPALPTGALPSAIMPTRPTPSPTESSLPTLRVGSVSYLNAKPLIHGLEEALDLRLRLEVPSRLLDGLRDGLLDVALLPIIDYQRMAGLRLIAGSGIGCDGPTLTVRIFSRVPIRDIRTLACDTDSHTSVALARILLAEHFRIHPRFSDLTPGDNASEALLLIGDKVVCDEPRGYEHQLDLGQAWKEMTGLPFLFAAWMTRDGLPLGTLPQRFETAKQAGLAHVDDLVQHYAAPRGWPPDIARRYMTEYLKYDVGERQLEAVRLFHRLAARHDLIPAVNALQLY
jgi:chorismate dehydratase